MIEEFDLTCITLKRYGKTRLGFEESNVRDRITKDWVMEDRMIMDQKMNDLTERDEGKECTIIHTVNPA